MRIFGLIGFPLDHSFSPLYFQQKFEKEGIRDAAYRIFPLSSIGLLPPLIASIPDLKGLNVTIPYKVDVLPYLQELDTVAASVGAVNTITLRKESGKTLLKGYNTDVTGFKESLLPLLHAGHNKALIFGTGGAAKAVAHVLDSLGITNHYATRSPKQAKGFTYQNLTPEILASYPLLVNTVPAAVQHPLGEILSLSGTENAAFFGPGKLLYDLNYGSAETPFLKLASGTEATRKNGLEMLHIQAEASWKIWNEGA